MSYWIKTENDGLFLSTQPFMNGNVLLSTGTFLLLTNRQPYDPHYIKFHRGLRLCVLDRGLYKRNPTNLDEHGPDDLFGLPLYSKGVAADVWDRLQKKFFFYQNDGGMWRMKSWMGRFPALLAHIQMCATWKKPSWFYRKAWCFAVSLTKNKKITDQDGWIQTMIMVETYKYFRQWAQSPDMDEAMAIYEKHKPKISEVYRAYINDPSHPLVEVCNARGI